MQVITVFDKLTAQAFLKTLTEAMTPRPKARPASAQGMPGTDTPMEDVEGGDGDDNDAQGGWAREGPAMAHCQQALTNLAAVLAGSGLREDPELVRDAVDACTEICRCPRATGAPCWRRARAIR